MRLIIFIVLPLLIISVLFSGGFNTLKKPRSTPIPTPQETYVIEDASDSAKESLQIRNLTPKKNPTCENQKLAVDLLLDTSGSMCQPTCTKLNSMKQAVKTFASLLKSEDLVGVQDFSSIYPPQTQHARNIYTFGPYSAVNFTQSIDSLFSSGNTHMKDGFLLARSNIVAARQNYPASEYIWVLIFLTDGIPNDNLIIPPNPPEGPDEIQNPTDIATQMKQAGEVDRLISIGLDLGIYGSVLENYATNLLKNIATSPDDFYSAPSAEQLEGIYDDIAQKVCR